MHRSVFISYSRQDSAFADRLAADVESSGNPVWIDRSGIEPGRAWDEEVVLAIGRCTHFIVIVTPASTKSSNVKDEIALARNLGKKIIPALLATSRIPFRLLSTHYVDFRLDYGMGLSALLRALGTAVKQSGADESTREGTASEALPDAGDESGWQEELDRYPALNLLERFRLRRPQLHIRVHHRLKLRPNPEELRLFEALNDVRRSKGLEPQYASDRFRVLGDPLLKNGELYLDVAPFNYVSFAATRDGSTSAQRQEELRARLADLRWSGAGKAARLDPLRLVPLGTEIVLVTSDGKTLLRRRGASVQTETASWDVSVSGYVSPGDLITVPGRQTEVDIARTVVSEVTNEIGVMAGGNPADMIFLGLHNNRESGAIDVLVLWPIGITARELAALIHRRSVGTRVRFRTTLKSREPFVQDTDNLIVDFAPSDCLSAVREIHRQGDKFMPEALLCLAMALGALRQSASNEAR
jgi:hypothetical protein